MVSESEHDWQNGICTECSYGCEHTGGTATCVALAVCEHCGQHYGEKNRENHVGEMKWSKTATHHSRVYDCCGHIVVSESEHDWQDGICTECSYGCEHTGGTATCVALAVCEHCGQHYGEKNRENHVGEMKWSKTATHHSRVYDCCGHIVVSESEHDWQDGICTECSYGCEHLTSQNTHTCEYCKKIVSECKDDTKDHKCDVCGKTISECIDEDNDWKCDICGKITHVHAYQILKSDATYHWYVCECGEVDRDSKKAHALDSGVVAKPATHTTAGLSIHHCKICGVSVEKTIARIKGHSFGKWRFYDQEIHIQICICGEIKRESHDFTAWEVLQMPTVFEEGIEISKCKDCGYERTRPMEKLFSDTTSESVTEETTRVTETETTPAETTTVTSAETTKDTVETAETSATTDTETTSETTVSKQENESVIWIVCISLTVTVGVAGAVGILYWRKKSFHR